MEERLNDLERRLAQAQHCVRWLVAVAFLAPAVVVAFLALKPDVQAAQPRGAAKTRTVLQAPFDVVGTAGDRLITVEEKKGGGAMVWFYRSGNKVNAMVDCTPAGGSFALCMPDEKLGIVLDSLRDGGGVSIYNAGGKEGVLLRATTGQGTRLTLADKDGAVLFSKP
jgi:hypothetical protein